jgi:plastocyanin
MRTTLLGILCLTLLACSGDSPTGGDDDDRDDDDEPPPGVVIVEPTSFRPASITVSVGESVTWDNYLGQAHTITPIGHTQFERAEFDAEGEVLEVTFTTAGTFPYFCEFHGGMNGTVIVR